MQPYANMRFRNFTVSFVPMFGDIGFKAKNPEELNEAVRRRLLEDTRGSPKN
jgi:hypothetical protein